MQIEINARVGTESKLNFRRGKMQNEQLIKTIELLETVLIANAEMERDKKTDAAYHEANGYKKAVHDFVKMLLDNMEN